MIVDLVQSLSILVLTVIFCVALVHQRRRIEDLEDKLNRSDHSLDDVPEQVKKLADVTSEEKSDLEWLNSV